MSTPNPNPKEKKSLKMKKAPATEKPSLSPSEQNLLHAVVHNIPDRVELLLNRKANPNFEFSGPGSTPLMMAIAGKLMPQMGPLLLKAGADIHVRGPDDRNTPLMIQVKFKETSCLKELADGTLNLQNKNGKTALHFAVFCPGVLAELLKLGADTSIRSIKGDTPLFEAIKAKQCDAVKLLVNDSNREALHPLLRQTPLLVAAWMGSLPIVKYLVEEQHTNISATNPIAGNVLTIAYSLLHRDVVQYLLNNLRKLPNLAKESQFADWPTSAIKKYYGIVDGALDNEDYTHEAIERCIQGRIEAVDSFFKRHPKRRNLSPLRCIVKFCDSNEKLELANLLFKPPYRITIIK